MTWVKRQYAGFRWSRWVRLGSVARGDVPERMGIYRIRSIDPALLVYVGEGNLKGRIGKHWTRACNTPRHRASGFQSPRLEFLTRYREILGGYEVSWSQGPMDLSPKRRRKAHERRVLWTYRRETRRSALANHSRAERALYPVNGYESYSPQAQNLVHVSSRPIEPSGWSVWSDKWMGLRWTQVTSRRELKQGGFHDVQGFGLEWMKKGPAFYKALNPRLQLRRVGYKKSARLGALEVLRNLPEGTLIAWSNLPRGTARHECAEVVDDLIGAHLEETGRVPDCQF
jgi:hypothetical protein